LIVLPSHPRASAFGLSPGLESPDPSGRFCQVLLALGFTYTLRNAGSWKIIVAVVRDPVTA